MQVGCKPLQCVSSEDQAPPSSFLVEEGTPLPLREGHDVSSHPYPVPWGYVEEVRGSPGGRVQCQGSWVDVNWEEPEKKKILMTGEQLLQYQNWPLSTKGIGLVGRENLIGVFNLLMWAINSPDTVYFM